MEKTPKTPEQTIQPENTALKSAFSARHAKESAKKKDTKITASEETKAAWRAHFGEEKIAAWKNQFGGRELIALAVDGRFAALRPVTADDLGDYMTSMGENGLSKAVIFIIEQLWIEGDLALIENEDYFIAVFMQVNNILEGKKAEYFRS